jgi:hypothetical protein
MIRKLDLLFWDELREAPTESTSVTGLALYKEPNRVDHMKMETSSFRKVVLFSHLELRTMDEVQKRSESETYWDEQMNTVEMGWTCGAHRKKRKCKHKPLENLKETDLFGDSAVRGSIVHNLF